MTSGSSPTAWTQDLSSGEILSRFTAPANTICAAWSPDGRQVATGCYDFNAYVWDAASGEKLSTIRGHRSEVYGLGFHESNRYLFTSSWDDTSRIWIPEDGESVLQLDSGGVRRFRGADELHVHPANSLGGVWDFEAGSRSCRSYYLLGSRFEKLVVLAFSPDGRFLAAGARDGLSVWDLEADRKLVHMTDAPPIRSIEFGLDGRSLLVGGPEGVHRLLLAAVLPAEGPPRWEIRTDQVLHSEPVNRLALNFEASLAAITTADRRIQLMDPRTGALRESLPAARGNGNTLLQPRREMAGGHRLARQRHANLGPRAPRQAGRPPGPRTNRERSLPPAPGHSDHRRGRTLPDLESRDHDR